MPLIEINQSLQVSATIRLDSETAALIDQYATFIHSSADDIVDKALSYVFSKDREFQEYLKIAQSRDVVPTLRVRRSGYLWSFPFRVYIHCIIYLHPLSIWSFAAATLLPPIRLPDRNSGPDP
jgi:hypothetical protein